MHNIEQEQIAEKTHLPVGSQAESGRLMQENTEQRKKAGRKNKELPLGGEYS